MSTSYLAIALDPARVWAAWGSNDQALLARARTEGEEIFEALFEDEAAKAPSWSAALAAFVAGTTPSNAWVHQNQLVVAGLAQLLGEELASDGWEAANADFVEEVGRVLADGGVALDLWALLSSEPPATIPTKNRYHVDDAILGFLDVEAVARHSPALAALKPPRGTDRYVAAAIADLGRWFRTAAQQRAGLFCLRA